MGRQSDTTGEIRRRTDFYVPAADLGFMGRDDANLGWCVDETTGTLTGCNLSDSQRLRGGVVFLEQLPMTSSGKIARGHLRTLVLTANRE
ncbi:unnamed protein product [Chrysodeixis includens]|uniref:AMP-binding enzyme C-terminal domain-containing protein n=1 Tax=Chrysodeixis includens TaxID=689277 RepID=A0A9N8L4U7_CHRIL|nr:unnamed protein product [Chrysodeixis includens]